MRISGIKSKLLLAFVIILIIITGLNVGLAIYLINQQGQREAFNNLTRQTILSQNELQKTTIDLRAIAEKTVSGTDNLSDLGTIYGRTQQMTTNSGQVVEVDRGLVFDKIISLNRLQVVLRSASFSSVAVYVDNELSHYVTTAEAGLTVIRAGHKTLIQTGQNQAGDLEFDNWPNWAEGAPPPLITSHLTLVNRPTISFDFAAEQRVILQIVVPVQATTQSVKRNIITTSYSEEILVDHLAIATPERLNQSTPDQNKPIIIGAFVFKKVFDRAFLEELAQKTGLLPALYSPDGKHQVQLVDLKLAPADLAQWARQEQAATEPHGQQRTLTVDQDAYYQALTLWQFEGQPRLIISFAQSAASTAQKVRETVTGLVGVAGLVLLVGGAVGYFLFDRLVKPIQTLTAAVSRIGLNAQQEDPGQPVTPIASDKLVEIDLHTGDEMGQLTTAFNAMIRQLRQSFETLEERVANRTHELSESNRQLQLARDAADEARRAAETATQQSQVALLETRGLFQAAQAILGATKLEDICQNLIYHFCVLVQADRMALFLVDHNRQQVMLKIGQSFSANEMDLTYTDLQSGISGLVFKTKQPVLSLHPGDGIEPEATRARRWQTCPGPLIVVPLISKGTVIGTITAISQPDQITFTPHHVELLMALATQAAAAIENVRLFEATQKARDELEQRVVERTIELAQANATLKEQIAVRLKTEAEREALIAELEAKNTELERFTYTVSHDLKSPLVTIRGFLGYLEQDALAGNMERTRQDIARIANATDKMHQLLNELLELSRLGRLMNPPEEVSLGELAQEAVSIVAGRLDQRGVVVNIAPNLPVVYGDRARLREVLENLIDNAAKYLGNQPQPCVEVGQQLNGAEPIFYVRDNGLGIDPRYHQKIFGLFEKLDQQVEGSGVGLAIVKRIIEAHGGRIWVESEGAGKGSTFCFTLKPKSIG